MTYEVQQTRWDRVVRRVTGSVGPGSRVSESISELMPVMDIERVPAELLILGGTQVVMGSSRAGAVAATFPHVSVRNPLESGNILTISSVQLFSTASQLLNIALSENVLPVAGTQEIRDGRRGVTSEPVGRSEIDNPLVVGPAGGTLRLQALEPFLWFDPNGIAVLPPGISLIISANQVNTSLEAGWLWRERPAEESELSL